MWERGRVVRGLCVVREGCVHVVRGLAHGESMCVGEGARGERLVRGERGMCAERRCVW
jgi:hypothetical protein